MALSLLAGPANAGKVALLLERYLADLAREPVLIVPTGSDVERVERDLIERAGALLGGSIGTFDDVFDQIAAGNGSIPSARRGGPANAASPAGRRRGEARRPPGVCRGSRDSRMPSGARSPSSRRGCSSRTISTATSPSCTAGIAASSTVSSSGTAIFGGATRPRGLPASSRRGTGGRSTPTASRI